MTARASTPPLTSLSRNAPRQIRYEDLLFNPEPTLQKICRCAGGTPASGATFRQQENSAKSGPGHGDGGSNRAKALSTYSSMDVRMADYSKSDVDYIQRYWDLELAQSLHYQLDFAMLGNSTT